MAAAGMHLPAHLPPNRQIQGGVHGHRKKSLGGAEKGRVD